MKLYDITAAIAAFLVLVKIIGAAAVVGAGADLHNTGPLIDECVAEGKSRPVCQDEIRERMRRE